MIVCMASGNGSNFEALVDSGIHIHLVITNKENAGVIDRAHRLGTPCIISKDDYEKHVPKNTKLVILAGFMKLLSKEFVERFKVVNIHPSLLPRFKGANAVKQTIDAGAKESGCTVHWVDEGMDTGSIIDQASCTVYDHDTEKTLHRRIHLLEHNLYPEVIREILLE